MAAYDACAYRGRPHSDYERNKYYDENVSRPVIVGHDGRIISRSPYQDTPNTYVVESETTELVYAPPLTDTYKHSSPVKDKWRRPSAAPEVDDFFNQMQIDVSRPHNNKYGTGYGAGGGYGHDYKPTANYPVRNYDNYDDYYRKTDGHTGDWNRPVNHATRPSRDSNKLGLPTNNIEEAIDYLKGTTAPHLSPHVTTNHHHPQTGRFESSSPVLRYDAEEAPRRYDYNYDNQNHQSSSPWTRPTVPQTTGHTTTARAAGVIDSNEAARRFNGKIVRI